MLGIELWPSDESDPSRCKWILRGEKPPHEHVRREPIALNETDLGCTDDDGSPASVLDSLPGPAPGPADVVEAVYEPARRVRGESGPIDRPRFLVGTAVRWDGPGWASAKPCRVCGGKPARVTVCVVCNAVGPGVKVESPPKILPERKSYVPDPLGGGVGHHAEGKPVPLKTKGKGKKRGYARARGERPMNIDLKALRARLGA